MQARVYGGLVVAALVAACGAPDDSGSASTASTLSGGSAGGVSSSDSGATTSSTTGSGGSSGSIGASGAGGGTSSVVSGAGGGSVDAGGASRDTGGGSSGAGGGSSDAGGTSTDASADRASDAGIDAAPAAPALRWLGRFASVPNATRIDWPGTGFVARFNGTSARVRLTTSLASAPADYYQVVVDSGAPTLLTTASGARDYDLATGLAPGVHTIIVWRRTEPLGSSVDVGAVTFGGGSLLAPPPESSKRLEIVGDSISVGFGVECKTISEGFTYATENNYQTYASLAARALGAELVTLAWSGIGMYRDVGGKTTATGTPQMPVRYLRAVAHEDASRWDFSKYTPGAVVVHLGTNDFAQGDPGQPFVQAYVDFAKDVRSRYPNARIYVALSPMLGGTNRTSARSYLTQVISTRRADGDTNMAMIEFASPTSTGWGCGHPNAATHEIMATVLEQALKADLGW